MPQLTRVACAPDEAWIVQPSTLSLRLFGWKAAPIRGISYFLQVAVRTGDKLSSVRMPAKYAPEFHRHHAGQTPASCFSNWTRFPLRSSSARRAGE